MPNDNRDEEKRERILEALRGGASIAAAARAGGIARQTFHRWRQQDEDFAIACRDAEEQGTDHLEDVARTRAEQSSDTLLIFLLKARRPQKYTDKHQILSVTQQLGSGVDRKRLERVQQAAADDPELAQRLAELATALEDK